MKQYKKFLAGFMMGAGLAGLAVFLMINRQFKIELSLQQDQINHQTELMDSMRNSNLPSLMRNVLENVDSELKEHPGQILSDETISRIAALAYASKPYLLSAGDSLTGWKMSPERGQLLLFLLSMKLDSISMQKIKQKSSFEGADLREADLKGADLRRINLRGANLKGANLQAADCSGSDLSYANLWGANLGMVNLNGAVLKRADLSWADLNGATLVGSNLHEADVLSAQLRKTNLRGAFLQWTDFSGAFLNEADLSNSDLFRANLKRSQLIKADLSGAKMGYTILSEANLTEANMTNAALDNLVISENNWLSLLGKHMVSGAAEIQLNYTQIESISHDGSPYQLKKASE